MRRLLYLGILLFVACTNSYNIVNETKNPNTIVCPTQVPSVPLKSKSSCIINNGIELCWGISSYGFHTYTVKYTITNFVSETNDAQMIYWTLIPYEFSTFIENVYIKIHTNFEIEDTIDVWGYGNYGGTAYVYDGYIEMQSDDRLATDEYMTILVKFPSRTFNTTNKLNKVIDKIDHIIKKYDKNAIMAGIKD